MRQRFTQFFLLLLIVDGGLATAQSYASITLEGLNAKKVAIEASTSKE